MIHNCRRVFTASLGISSVVLACTHGLRGGLVSVGVVCALMLAGGTKAQASTYYVDTSATSAMLVNANDGYCSLAEAVASANFGHSRYNCPEIDSGNPDQTIFLRAAPNRPFNTNHYVITSLIIDSPNRRVYITGAGLTPLVDSTGTSGFIVRGTSWVMFQRVNLTYTGGSSGGRLVENQGTLSLYGVTLANGNVTTHPTGRGGAIYNVGLIPFTQSVIIQNCRAKRGGAVYNDGGNMVLQGFMTISNNTATMAGGGVYNGSTASAIGQFDSNGYLTVTSNSAPAGGGIFNAGRMLLYGATISSNHATGFGSGEQDFFGNSCDGMGGGVEYKVVQNASGTSYTQFAVDSTDPVAGSFTNNTAASSRGGGAIAGDLTGIQPGSLTFSGNGYRQCRAATGVNTFGPVDNCP